MNRSWRAGLEFLLLAILIAAGGTAAYADANGDGRPLFASSKARFLTTGERDFWPCFSPDGTRVLFSRRVGDGWELFLVPMAGGEAVKLVSSLLSVSATRANWSRRNNLIAFTGIFSTDKATVWLINPDGSSAHTVGLATLSDKAFYPSWYPDGQQIAVMDAADFSIKRIDLSTGVVTMLTDPKKVYTGMPSVSPDGKWVAFAGQQNRGQPYDQTKNSIWLLEVNGVPRTVEPNPGQGRAPTWSPSGEQLVFESNRGSRNGLYAVFLINRDGTKITQLTDSDLNADHPVWSPDGRHIAFSAHDAMQLPGRRGIGIIDLPKDDASRPTR